MDQHGGRESQERREPYRHEVGLALSGGGARAAAFHRGTVAALAELSLLSRIGVVSTVSGGSIFAAGWIAALEAGESSQTFLRQVRETLRRGFIRPALVSRRPLRLVRPGYSRSHLLADLYDELLTRGRTLDAPQSRGPLLCVNAAVLNHGQAGRFTLGGFSCKSVGQEETSPRLREFPLPGRTLGFAAAASAAFPFGLPPVALSDEDIPREFFHAPLEGHRRLLLTDGGVLENLGVQLLMRSRRFGARHLVVSDAGAIERAWQPGLVGRLRALGAFALTTGVLDQVILIMNSKQNRSMREIVTGEVGGHPSPIARRLLFVRIDQSWGSFLTAIPAWRRLELATGPGRVKPPGRTARPHQVEEFLAACGVALSPLRDLYREIGGDRGAGAAGRIGIHLVGLSDAELDLLAAHARWQVHATHAIYGPIPVLTAPAPIPAITQPGGPPVSPSRRA